MSRVKNVFKGNAGFTLIELLIVIVIIGILAAIAIPNIAGLTQRADLSTIESNMRTLMTDMESYRANNGEYAIASNGDELSIEPDNDLPDFVSSALEELNDVDRLEFTIDGDDNTTRAYKITANISDLDLDTNIETITIENGRYSTTTTG